jgi:hypothetical protein
VTIVHYGTNGISMDFKNHLPCQRCSGVSELHHRGPGLATQVSARRGSRGVPHCAMFFERACVRACVCANLVDVNGREQCPYTRRRAPFAGSFSCHPLKYPAGPSTPQALSTLSTLSTLRTHEFRAAEFEFDHQAARQC